MLRNRMTGGIAATLALAFAALATNASGGVITPSTGTPHVTTPAPVSPSAPPSAPLPSPAPTPTSGSPVQPIETENPYGSPDNSGSTESNSRAPIEIKNPYVPPDDSGNWMWRRGDWVWAPGGVPDPKNPKPASGEYPKGQEFYFQPCEWNHSLDCPPRREPKPLSPDGPPNPLTPDGPPNPDPPSGSSDDADADSDPADLSSGLDFGLGASGSTTTCPKEKTPEDDPLCLS
jgi:hypothetical protein